ncbi:MAG: site-2 protease family protein [Sedimentisphaerales bacterium]|nr:site-2 protease family protein [Sedimentisphaerales bacterium]
MPETKSVSSRNKNIIFLLILLAVIYLIVTNLDVSGNLLLVALGFGAVIMIHEFGHFITAKLSGINVQAFSIGFSPVLAGIKRTEQGWRIRILPQFFAKEGEDDGNGTLTFTVGGPQKPGETEYRIGLIPFGGFVKMLGQEDVGSVEANTDPRSFANKPLLTRIAVVSAGVIFNALSAIVIFMIAFMIGVRLPAPIVGGVMPNSPAAAAGIRAGDKVLAVDGKTDIDFTNIALAAALSDVNEKTLLKIQHLDGSIAEVQIAAAKLPGSSPQMPRGFGIMQGQTLTIADTKDPNAEYRKKLGLEPGDTIVVVNGKEIKGSWELADILETTLAPSLQITAVRTNKITGQTSQVNASMPLDLVISPARGEKEESLNQIASMVPRLKIIGIVPKGKMSQILENVRIKLGMMQKSQELKDSDIILSVDDVQNPTYAELRQVVQEYKSKSLSISVLRTNANRGYDVHNLTVYPRPSSADPNRAVIGINLALDVAHPVVAKTIAAENGGASLDIPRGSVITAVSGTPITDWRDVITTLKSNKGKAVAIAFKTPQDVAGAASLDVPNDPNFITAQSAFAVELPFRDLRQTYKAKSPLDAVAMGYDRTTMFIVQTYITLKGLFVGLISPKALMGPAGILKISYKIVEERMWTFYLYFMGLISASIAVMNFLPFPVLDGGVITLMLIEKVKGSPISERTQSAIAYTGLVLIMAFFLYVTWNDLTGVLFK